MFDKNIKYKVLEDITIICSNDKDYNKVSDFYDNLPFPEYAKNDDKFSITKKGNEKLIAKQFKNTIGFNKIILEAGSGTSQLSNYLAIGNNNKIVALDSSLNALKLGKKFSDENNVKNIKYIKGDLTTKIFIDEIFDFIWCSGVLHHTKNPSKGFEQLCNSLKKEGIILIGLYNKYGRIKTLIRKFIFKYISKNLVHKLDPYLKFLNKNKEINKRKIDAWVQDQYEHPIESLHTFDETLEWFKKNNIEFINSIPQCNNEDFLTKSFMNYFNKSDSGNFFSRFLSQLLMLFTTHGSEGGLYIFIGKKNDHNK
jgi:ubiquinone/menaquinone biosynthesis C-methylase UbiE